MQADEIKCWRFQGTIPGGPGEDGKARLTENYRCGVAPSIITENGFDYGILSGYKMQGDDFDWNIVIGSGSYSQVDSDDFTDGFVSFGNCQTCLTRYDCINGECYPKDRYNTPGYYSSADECANNCGEGEVKFNSISVPVFSSCDTTGKPINIMQEVSVIEGTEDCELLKFQQLADIQGETNCNPCVAALPDSWLIRPEFHRPQVIYQFAEINSSEHIVGSPCYKITVPHHVSDKPQNALPNYKRGNWELIFVLKDNSKVTIHGFNEANAMQMLTAIKLRIDADYLVGSYISKSGLVVSDNKIAEITVKNRMAKYYATGAKKNIPDWLVKW